MKIDMLIKTISTNPKAKPILALLYRIHPSCDERCRKLARIYERSESDFLSWKKLTLVNKSIFRGVIQLNYNRIEGIGVLRYEHQFKVYWNSLKMMRLRLQLPKLFPGQRIDFYPLRTIVIGDAYIIICIVESLTIVTTVQYTCYVLSLRDGNTLSKMEKLMLIGVFQQQILLTIYEGRFRQFSIVGGIIDKMKEIPNCHLKKNYYQILISKVFDNEGKLFTIEQSIALSPHIIIYNVFMHNNEIIGLDIIKTVEFIGIKFSEISLVFF